MDDMGSVACTWILQANDLAGVNQLEKPAQVQLGGGGGCQSGHVAGGGYCTGGRCQCAPLPPFWPFMSLFPYLPPFPPPLPPLPDFPCFPALPPLSLLLLGVASSLPFPFESEPFLFACAKHAVSASNIGSWQQITRVLRTNSSIAAAGSCSMVICF